MNDFVPKKPVGTFNFVEPELKVVTVVPRQPAISLENNVQVSAGVDFDQKMIDAIVRKFMLWNT